MSRKTGKICAIQKDFKSNVLTMQTALSQKGYSRIPGTGVFKFPYKELNGKYRTGLDENADYLNRILDPVERELERDAILKRKEELAITFPGIDLSPTSKFWRYDLDGDGNQHVQPFKLIDGDNYFDLSQPIQAVTFYWLSVHPTVAKSYVAWERGEYPADTQWYVADEEYETELQYKKKEIINKAIEKLNNMTPERRKKVARLLGLPVTDDTKETAVYNLIDNCIKSGETKKNGSYAGMDTVKAFNQIVSMKESLLHVKDLIEQAIQHSVYRVKQSGKIFEGEYEVAKDKDDLLKILVNEDNQEDLLILENKLKGKKIAAI